MYLKNNKGFTLIELLVVIAIIGLLASVVLASLGSARGKARDANIKAEMSEVEKLMALNYEQYGSYCQIQPGGWVTASGYTCDALLSNGNFSGTYAQQARDLCKNIYNNGGGDPEYRLLIYVDPSSYTCTGSYSWQVLLNDGNWFCTGSSGRKGVYPSYYGYPGCYTDP